MKISNLIPAYLLPFSLFCQVLGAPTNGKRGNVVVVKVKTTVQQTQTDIQTISEATGTTTNYLINTSTETFTRYTATVTSTVYGVPHTYTTVATTPVSAADVIPNSENEVKSSLQKVPWNKKLQLLPPLSLLPQLLLLRTRFHHKKLLPQPQFHLKQHQLLALCHHLHNKLQL